MTVVKGDDVIDLTDRREFEVVHLSEFDDGQIREALRKLYRTTGSDCSIGFAGCQTSKIWRTGLCCWE